MTRFHDKSFSLFISSGLVDGLELSGRDNGISTQKRRSSRAKEINKVN